LDESSSELDYIDLTLTPSRQRNPARRKPSAPTRIRSPSSSDDRQTPPLAMADIPESPLSPLTQRVQASDLSFPQRNTIVMAIQHQVKWDVIAEDVGIDVNKVIQWWIRASADMARQG